MAIYRRLAEARPDAVVPNLARSLWVLTECLAALGKSEEALTTVRESISGLSPMFLREPRAHAGLMAAVLKRYVELSEKAGHDLDMELIGPALELSAQLQGDNDEDEE